MKALVHHRLSRYVAVLGAVAVVGILPGSSLASGQSSSDVATVNTETIQTYLNADAEISTSRIYEQLTLVGDGSVTVDNPVGPNKVRNLDGFGGVDVNDGVQQQQFDVNGVARGRTVSDFDSSKLPLSVDVTYVLDGKKVSAGDLVGASGDLKVVYTVKNLTAKQMPLTFSDGAGGTKTEMTEVPIPLVGTVVFDLPSNFSHVQSRAASMGGDGHGGTQMEYLLTLFPPIGSTTVNFGYTAHLTNGLLPPVSFTAVPVDPLSNPTFSTAADSYQSGAATGEELAAGATKINTNLLRLRDGAAKLVGGLVKINAGAHLLSSGLVDQAAPGSQKLAAGAGQLSAGMQQANTGGKKLSAGIDELNSAIETLPNTLNHNPDYQKLLGALTAIANGVGDRDDPITKKTILGGLNAIQQGLEVTGSNDCITATIDKVEPKKCGAIDAVGALGDSVSLSRSQGPGLTLSGTPPNKLKIWSEGDIIAQLDGIKSDPGCAQSCQDKVDSLRAWFLTDGQYDQQLATLETSLKTIVSKANDQLLDPGAGLDQLRDGLSFGTVEGCTQGKKCGIKQAALAVRAGIPQLVAGLQEQILAGLGNAKPGCDPTKTLRCGAAALSDGLGKLDDGSQQLADGANQLSDGLGTAASGSAQLADGTQQAASGSPALVDGAEALSRRGVVKIVAAGEDTAQQYGQLYASLQAGAQRAHNDGMMFGAPTGAMGLMAYDFEIDGSSSQSSHDAVRLLLAAVFAGLGLGAFALRRRRAAA